MPLKNEPGQSDWWLELTNDPAQNISLSELSSSFNDASNRVNDPNLFFSLFNSELSVSVNNSLPSRQNFPINGLLACNPGERRISTSNSSLFARSVVTALTTESSHLTTYQDLLYRVERNMLLHTSRQHPSLIYSGSKPAVFNSLFTKSSVYFLVTSQTDNQTVIINAGQNINILPGTWVRFYPVNAVDTSKKMITRGVVTSSDEVTSVVKLVSPFADAKQNLWAFIGWNDRAEAEIDPLIFNTSFQQSGNE